MAAATRTGGVFSLASSCSVHNFNINPQMCSEERVSGDEAMFVHWSLTLPLQEEELQFERVNETVRLFERELAKINHQIIQITFHTSTWQQLIQLAKPRKGTESLTPWKGVWPHPRPHLKVGSLATAVPRRTVSTTWQQRQKVTFYRSTYGSN